MIRRRLPALLVLTALGAACTGATHPAARASAAATPAPVSSTTPTAAPTPKLPAYYIESLRDRPYPPGRLEIQDQMFRGAGFTKFHMSWPSDGQTMTGTISVPDGDGPFPVVVVNHGYIPASRYWIGQDSGIFGDPLAAHGFISVAPNWPGYSGSGPAPSDLPSIVGQVVAALDLVSALYGYPKADTTRLAFIGHSNGGGISEIAMVVDPRIKAVVLFAPVSSDMADNGRKWWLNRPEGPGPIGTPDSNPDGYAHLSPRNYLAKGQPPVLFLQGTADEDIPATWTQATYDALRGHGITTDLVWIPGAHHDLVGADLDHANQQSETWIRKSLGV